MFNETRGKEVCSIMAKQAARSGLRSHQAPGRKSKTPLTATFKPSSSKERKSPRVSFVNTANLWDFRTEARITARVNDLSQGGCYLDTTNPLPVGTQFKLTIRRGEDTLSVYAVVVYVAQNLGMGVSFTHIAAGDTEILRKWLAQG